MMRSGAFGNKYQRCFLHTPRTAKRPALDLFAEELRLAQVQLSSATREFSPVIYWMWFSAGSVSASKFILIAEQQ